MWSERYATAHSRLEVDPFLKMWSFEAGGWPISYMWLFEAGGGPISQMWWLILVRTGGVGHIAPDIRELRDQTRIFV